MSWELQDILDLCVEALQAESELLDRYQEPKGLDSLEEKRLQGIVAEGLAARGHRVLREEPFPSIRRKGAKLSQRERCDLVVLREETTRIGAESEAAGRPQVAAAWLASGAFWLEMKVLGQFEYRSGVPGPNHQYATRLVKALHDDLQKLADDPEIRFGAVLDVLFVREPAVAVHDMGVALGRCVDRNLIPGEVRRGEFRIADRIGNAWCTLWLTGVRRS